jgi:hypothetical protein
VTVVCIKTFDVPGCKSVLAICALVICTWAVSANAQTSRDRPDRPTTNAVRISRSPNVDGDILNDPAWVGVPASGGFIQNAPDEGQPSSQRTEVRVAFTDTTLYIGVVCHDDEPEAIIVSDARRDASLSESDSVQIILDTFLDGQNGFVFGTNPSGLQYDGQVTRDGAGGFFGASGGFNLNWDGVWLVGTDMGDYGWSAEFAIPFKTIRYRGGGIQTWGMNVQRNIRRRNETAYWAPLERQFDLFRVYDAGRLTGIEAPNTRNLKIVPYLLSDLSDVGSEGTEHDLEAGIDIKYSLTEALTLDLTYNTDFAQVEVDEVQINLDRFNLLFPEKRPFFLENAGQFAVGQPEEIELFFSRRIGISEEDEVIPIEGGARVSGKIDRTNVGLLFMRTQKLGDRVPAEHFMVGRVNQELGRRSSLGAIYVRREATGSLAGADKENQTFGVDGRWGIGDYLMLSGFAAKSITPSLDGDDHSFSVDGSYDIEAWSMNLSYAEVGENFNPEAGFLRRSNYRSPSGFIMYRYRPDDFWGLQELRPHASYTSYINFDGFQESARLHLDNHWEFKSSAEIHTGVNFTQEGLLEPFEIHDGVIVPAGTYHNEELALYAHSNASAPFSVNFDATIGGFFNGKRVRVNGGISWRIGDRFTSEWGWERNDVDLDTGDFVTNLGRIRLSYAFTPSITVQALFQYNDVDELWSSNLRFSWLRTANTGLFIVYNEIQGFGDYVGEKPNRSLLIKYTRLFEVF